MATEQEQAQWARMGFLPDPRQCKCRDWTRSARGGDLQLGVDVHARACPYSPIQSAKVTDAHPASVLIEHWESEQKQLAGFHSDPKQCKCRDWTRSSRAEDPLALGREVHAATCPHSALAPGGGS